MRFSTSKIEIQPDDVSSMKAYFTCDYNLRVKALYRNNLKNREYAREAPSICARLNGAEKAKLKKFSDAGEGKLSGCPTPAETDSSGCFGIYV